MDELNRLVRLHRRTKQFSSSRRTACIMNVGRFAYKSFRLQVDSLTLTSIRLHDVSCFAYTFRGDSPTQ